MSSFSVALELLKQGNKVCRSAWDNSMFIGYAKNGSNNFITAPILYVESDGQRIPWIPNCISLFAEDWIVYDKIASDSSKPDNVIVPDTPIQAFNILDETWKLIQKWEGGSKYTNDPRDPGGPTKYGIAWNYNKDIVKEITGKTGEEAIKSLTEAQSLLIFENKYWIPCKCASFPDAIAMMYGNICFNIGQGNSPRLLQKTCNQFKDINISVDGKIGPATIGAVNSIVERGMYKNFINVFCNIIMEYYKSRSGWSTYGKGWTNRTDDFLKKCLEIANK